MYRPRHSAFLLLSFALWPTSAGAQDGATPDREVVADFRPSVAHRLDAGVLPAGVYVVRLRAGDAVLSRRLTLLR